MSACALLVWLAAAATTPYHWPLDLPPELTSSFGEYRTGRYHAGIDLRTGGIGLPVYAAADGYVSRVRCSPWGYGKAVYLQLEDGNTAVYAHLDDYYDALRAFVQREQHRQQSYSIDVTLSPGQFPVARGQLIAKAGDTGIGAPHLHYELRDGAQRPLNPRALGIDWPDSSAPQVRQILVAPLGPDATVNGDVLPKVVDVVYADGTYTAPAVRAQGRIALAVNTVDRGPSGNYRLDPYRIAVDVDGATVFVLQRDKLSYDTHRDGVVGWHPFFLSEGRYTTLWRWPGNDSQPYQHTASDGTFTVAGDCRVRLTLEDFQGNTSTAQLPIVLDAKHEPAAPAATGTGQATGNMECLGEMLIFETRFTAAEPQAPVLVVNQTSRHTARRIDAQTYRLMWRPERSGRYEFTIDHPRVAPFYREVGAWVRGDAATLTLGDGVRVSVPGDAPFGALYLRVYRFETSLGSGMRKMGPAFRLWPEAMPIDTDITVQLPADEALSGKVHAYRHAGRYWSRQSTERSGSTATIRVDDLGTYQLMEDTRAPSINNFSPPDGYRAQTRRPIIHATMTDGGSGLEDYNVYLGGQWLLCEFDPDNNRVTWERDEDLPSGTHTLVFRATDAAGNTARAERTVVIP